MLRLALIPVFVGCLATGASGTDASSWRVAAFGVFAVASVTDLLDGELARRRGLITDFGKIADPIADKALTGSALITLSALGELSWWVTWVILFREVAVTALRFWVIRYGVIPASRGGKIKTVLQMVAIGLYILPIQIGMVRPAIMAAALVVTLATGADYLARAVSLRRGARRGAVVLTSVGPAERELPPGDEPVAGPQDPGGRETVAGREGPRELELLEEPEPPAGREPPVEREGPAERVQPAVGAVGDLEQTE